MREPNWITETPGSPEEWVKQGKTTGLCKRPWYAFLLRDEGCKGYRIIEYSEGLVDAIECRRCGRRWTDFMG